MSAKSECLAIDQSLYCRAFRVGMGVYIAYQIFKGEHCFSAPAQSENQAWELAKENLSKELSQ